MQTTPRELLTETLDMNVPGKYARKKTSCTKTGQYQEVVRDLTITSNAPNVVSDLPGRIPRHQRTTTPQTKNLLTTQGKVSGVCAKPRKRGLGEQLTYNQRATGSIPVRPTI